MSAIAEIASGNPAPQEDVYFADGEFPFVRTSDVGAVHLSTSFSGSADKVNQQAVEQLRLRLFPAGTILFPKSGASTFLNHRVVLSAPAYVSSHLACIVCDETKALPRFVYRVLCQIDARDITPDQAYPSLRLAEIGEIEIPLPPLEVQKEIVAEIEGYQKVIDGARAVLDNYRPHIPINPDWPTVRLGDIADVKLGKMLDRLKHQKGTVLPYVRNVSVRWGTIDTHDLPEMYFEEDELDRFGLRAGDVLVCEGGEPGRAAVWDGRIPNLKYQKALHRVRFKVPFEPSMLVYLLQEMALSGALVGWLSGTTIKHLTLESFNKLPIPLPPLATQQAIVAEIEAEQALVNGNRKLIARFEKKIQATLARIWGEDAPDIAHSGAVVDASVSADPDFDARQELRWVAEPQAPDYSPPEVSLSRSHPPRTTMPGGVATASGIGDEDCDEAGQSA